MLALKFHPEKNIDNPVAIKTFHQVAEAFDVLSDSKRRATYDQWGSDGLRKTITTEDGGPCTCYLEDVSLLNLLIDLPVGVTEPYQFTELKSLDIFKTFFGTANPFTTFGFADTVPYEAAFKDEGPKKAPPIEKELVCTLEELYTGCTKKLTLTRKVSLRSGYNVRISSTNWSHEGAFGFI